MNKCPRCENENLKEDYKYCPVCGVNLGTAPEVPVQEQPIKIALGGHEIAKTLHAHGEVLKEQEQYEFESFHKSYPTEITIIAPISPYKEIGIEPLNKDCNEAVRINLQIDSPLYRKEEVLKSIKYAINKILANYI